MTGTNSGGIATDLDRILAARSAAGRLALIMVQIPEIDRILGSPKPARIWVHQISRRGAITSRGW